MDAEMGWRFGVLFIRYLEVGRVWLVLICGTWYVRGGGSHGEVCMGCGEGGGASWGIRGWIWESVVGFRGGGVNLKSWPRDVWSLSFALIRWFC